MDALMIRLVIAVAVIFLTDKLLTVVPVNPQARSALEIVILILAILYVVFGHALAFS